MKLLVLLSRIPYRLDKGDKLRAFYQIRELAKKHEIILFALAEDSDPLLEATAELQQYCRHLYFFPLSKSQHVVGLARTFTNNKPAQVNYFYNPEAQQQVNEIIARHRPDAIYCQLVRMAEYVRHVTGIPKTLDYQDAFSKGMTRRADIAPFYLKPVYQFEAGRLATYEAEVLRDFDHTTMISRQDRNLIEHPDNQQITIAPNGIDLEFFHALERPKKFELVFAGNMSYPPNVETAVFLVKKVMPLVYKQFPKARLLLAGATPSHRVLSLQSDNVYVSGWMDDIREAYASADIFVAPMTIGTGVQNKVLEAMAMQVPCIISGLVNNGIGATPGEQVLVAGEADEIAGQIVSLLENPARAKVLAQKAYDFVRKNYGWEAAVASLEAVLLPKPRSVG